MARVEELTDIPPGEVEKVIKIFEAQGAKVKKIKQANGNFTVRATFNADAKSSNEDDLDCCDHSVSEEDSVPDEDLPVAVGGVE